MWIYPSTPQDWVAQLLLWGMAALGGAHDVIVGAVVRVAGWGWGV